MTDSIRNKIIRYALILLVCVVVGYGLFRVYPIFMGPVITLYTPKNGDRVASSTFLVSGKVERAKEIKVQGRPISINTEGLFNETLAVHAPYTILVIEASDAYGKKIRKVLQISPAQ